ncbi:MAG: CobQ/CobB/MinD/ParA nucleotide binding domain protein [Parcubacteria group bacterium]|nr:CobQ/CobB/MinD/ParA nucleotide binding domain protein [Parcubacteria group bacterium]
MKIACIGKGGSGKSTISWLLVQLLAAQRRQVLAIDADHNMDLVSLLGKEIGPDTPTMHRRHDAFRDTVGLKEDKNWGRIVLEEDRVLPSFALDPEDSYTRSIRIPINDSVSLIAVGLGSDDVLFSDRCSHGHSAPLKFYLPFLDEGADTDVVIDGVAGADMMNFGLFLGADAVLVVVEPHRNSMRVLSQVAAIAERSNLPLFAVINKADSNPELTQQIEQEWGSRIVGHIPADAGLLAYDLARVAEATRESGENLLSELRSRTAKRNDTLVRIRAFERERSKAKA